MTQIYKNGNIIITHPPQNLADKNLYTHSNLRWASNCHMEENYKTDIFESYGFTSCSKLYPCSDSERYYWNTTTGQFMSYCYIGDKTIKYDVKTEFVVSMYVYVSVDCNADFRLHLEHSCAYTEMYHTNNNSSSTTWAIIDNTKGKVFWVWAKFKPNQTDGLVYIMFYPNPNLANVFTQGYILYTGAQIYQGSEIYRPSYDGSIHGIYSIPNSKNIYENKIEFDDFIEY